MQEEIRKAIERREAVVNRLKSTFIDNLHLNLEPDEIDPDAALFGTGLELDSIDAVDVAIAIQTAFGVKLRSIASKASFRTLNTIADLILEVQRHHGSA
jgi:acyl carrier protein